MEEIHKIERYEVRGNIVWDKTQKRPAQIDEIKDALEFYSTAKAVLNKCRELEINDKPF